MLFSIVTVCFKNPIELQATLDSISIQSCTNYQVIVVDGNSGKCISDVVESFEPLVDVFITEPDKGVYDAMNKGAAEATGDFVIYMNSGDRFYSKDVLSNVEKRIAESSTVSAVYGDTITDYEYKQTYCKAGAPSSFLRSDFYSLSFSHQSIFVKRSLLGDTPFDMSYKVVADFNFLYPLLRNYNDSLVQMFEPFSVFASGGLSDMDKTVMNREIKRVYFDNNSFSVIAYLHFTKLIVLETIKKRLRPILRNLRV